MKSIELGGSSVPNMALGLMRIGDKSDDEIRTLVGAARDAGIDFFDHADIYGGAPHRSETRFGEALRLSPAERADVTIQSKAGIVPGGPHYDFSYDHLVSSVEASLAALRTDYLDIFLLHRPDALVEPEEVARAFDHLESTGKVRAFGVSNHTPSQIDLLRTAIRQPIVVNQLQLSLVHAPIIAHGIAANMLGDEQSLSVDGGVLDYCRTNTITVQAWGPFQGRGRVFLGSDEHRKLNGVIDRLATQYGVTSTAIAAAWITRHPAGIQVVLGTTTPSRITEAAVGSDLPLKRAEWYELFRAAGHSIP